MKKLIFFSLLSIMALAAVAQTTDTTPYVEVQGKASRLVEPNRIEVRISLSEAVSKGKVKITELESKLATALQQANVDASKQLVIVSQSSAAQKKTGVYQFKNYLLTLSSPEEMSALFDALAANGIQDASVGRMYNTNQDQIDKELQAEAMLNSKQVAQNLAKSVGQSIAEAIQIQYWANGPSVNYGSENMLLMRAKSADVTMSSLPEDLTMRPINVQVSVTVRYLLLNK